MDVTDIMSKHYLICTIVLMSSTLIQSKILLRLWNMNFEEGVARFFHLT